MVGGSFTGLTVNRKLVLAVPPSASLTVMVMVAVPYRLGRGVKATVRLVPSPVKMIFLSVISAGLDELPVTTRLVGADSASFTVNATPATGVSSSVVWAVMLEMVGGSFTGLTVNRKLVRSEERRVGQAGRLRVCRQ